MEYEQSRMQRGRAAGVVDDTRVALGGVRPSFIGLPQSSISVHEYEPLTMRCVVDGLPKPTGALASCFVHSPDPQVRYAVASSFTWIGFRQVDPSVCDVVFTARCYASAVLAMALCPYVRPSVRHKSEFY